MIRYQGHESRQAPKRSHGEETHDNSLGWSEPGYGTYTTRGLTLNAFDKLHSSQSKLFMKTGIFRFLLSRKYPLTCA